MEENQRWRFILFLIIGATADSISASCGMYVMQNCQARFNEYKAEVQHAFFADHDLSTMRKICTEWHYVESCLDSVLQTCSTVDKLTVEGLENAYEFVCSKEGLATYERIHECLGNQTLSRRGHDCSERFLRDSTEGDKTLCWNSNNLINCVHSAVKQHCGQEAADWQTRVNKEALRPPASKDAECRFDGELGNMAIGSIAVGTALTVIIIVIVTVVVCKKKKKCRRAAIQANSSTTMVHSEQPLASGAPPRYSLASAYPKPEDPPPPYALALTYPMTEDAAPPYPPTSAYPTTEV